MMQRKRISFIFMIMALSLTTGFSQSYNQNTRPNNTSLPYPNTYDTSLNPNICDTVNYIFSKIADSFKSIKGEQTSFLQNRDSNSVTRISYSRIPGSMSDNIITGSPFVFFCPYRSGKDSTSMYNVYTTLISGISNCLLNGPVQNLSVYYTRGTENARIIRYTFLIKDLKPGIDPKLKNATVSIEFNPDNRGIQNDHFITYRVNIIIRS